MPSPLDFIQATVPKALAGSKSELDAKTALDESGASAGEAFSAAFNQALNSQRNKPDKSNPASNEKPFEAASNLKVDSAVPVQAGQIDPLDKKIHKKAEEEATVELAMAEGLTTLKPLADDPQIAEGRTGFSDVKSQSETLPMLDASDTQTGLIEDTGTRLAQSVGLGTLSPEALLMMGLPPAFQAKSTMNDMNLAPTTEPDNTVPASLELAPGSSSAIPAARFNNPVNVTPTGLIPLPSSPSFSEAVDKQGLGLEEAIPQSALPAQTQADPLAQAAVFLESRSSELPIALAQSGASEISEWSQTPNPIRLPDASNTPNSPQGISTEILETTTSPLTPSSPETSQGMQTLPSPFNLPTPESTSPAQEPAQTTSVPSLEMLEQTPIMAFSPGASYTTGAKENDLSLKSATSDISVNTATNQKASNQQTPLNSPASLQALTDFQQSLSAMGAEVEALTESPEPANPQGLSEVPAFERVDQAQSASDSLPPASLASPLPASVGFSQDMAANGPDKLPYFASLAENPVDQVVEGTAYSVKNGQKELILKINPDNLGEVRIRLTSHGNNEVSARLIASTQEGHELLKTQSETLRASLEAQGIRIEKLSVMLAGHTDNGTNPNKQDQPSQFQQQTSNQAQSQQQSFQQSNQSFNPFFQANNGAYQNKQGFAQNPGTLNNRLAQGSEESSGRSTESVSRRNDNGNVSVLA
jgi:flagellar hook-length control protein FliK